MQLITTRLKKHFFQLVQIDSETESEQAISNYCCRFLRSLKIPVTQDRYGNVSAEIRHSAAKEWIMLSAHLDTVAPGRGVIPVLRAGIVHSKGKTILGADNKVMLAVILTIAETLHTSRASLNIEIALTVSEESDNLGAKQMMRRKWHSKNILLADSIMPIGSMVLAAPFYYRCNGKIVGTAAHASCDQKGGNAIKAFADFVQSVGDFDRPNAKLNIGIVSGGSARNTVPGETVFQGEIRCFRAGAFEQQRRILNRKAGLIAKKNKLQLFTIDWSWENDGYRISQSHLFVRSVARAIQLTGIVPSVQSTWVCSDANIFAAHGLIPVNIGDGVSGAHTDGECVRLSDLNRLYQIISAAIGLQL